MDFHQNFGFALPWRPTSSLGLPLLVMMMMILFYLSNGLLAQPDMPCSLSTGMSRESFTANELLPIGSVVGILNIVGDPSDNGTIELRLSQDDAVIEIPEGTKNITLRKSLDREGKDGPSEVNLQVYCRKKDSTQLVFPIPLRIFVNDANDNIPEFVDSPDLLKISEITQPGTVVTHRPIRAIDGDQTGPFSTVQYNIENGPYSDHFEFPNPLKGILMLTRSLDYEEVHHFNITIQAQDLGNPPAVSKVLIPVHVLDADDLNPSFDDERYNSVIPDKAQVGTLLLVKPRSIHARDMDEGINASIEYSFKSDQVDGKYFSINNITGEVTLVRPFTDDVIFPLTLVIKAFQVDNPERSALTTLSVSPYSSVNGDLHFLLPVYTCHIPETFPVNQTVVILQTNKLHSQVNNGEGDPVGLDRIRFATGKKDPLANFMSEIVFQCSQWFCRIFRCKQKFDFAEVKISIDDVNRHNPKFGSQLYNFVVMDNTLQAGLILGQVEVQDGDKSEYVNLNLIGEEANSFSINEEGVIEVLNSTILNSSLTHLIVMATDSGQPPRTASVPIIITVPDELRFSSMSLFASDSSYLLMIIFGATLGFLVLIVLVLALYIAKHKNTSEMNSHQSTQSLNKLSSYITGNHHEKLLEGTTGNGTENPTFRNDSQDEASLSNSPSNRSQADRSIASASTALVKNETRGSRLMATLCKMDVSSAKNDENRSVSSITSARDENNRKKDATRRAKKLSWEDEKANKTELDPNASVTPLRINTEDPEKSCYF